MVIGAQCVAMASPTLQQMLCVSSWGSLLLKGGPILEHRGKFSLNSVKCTLSRINSKLVYAV